MPAVFCAPFVRRYAGLFFDVNIVAKRVKTTHTDRQHNGKRAPPLFATSSRNNCTLKNVNTMKLPGFEKQLQTLIGVTK